MNQNSTLIVYSIIEGKDRNYWQKIGRAFVNRDGSINVLLNCLPLNGKLQIREEQPRFADDGNRRGMRLRQYGGPAPEVPDNPQASPETTGYFNQNDDDDIPF